MRCNFVSFSSSPKEKLLDQILRNLLADYIISDNYFTLIVPGHHSDQLNIHDYDDPKFVYDLSINNSNNISLSWDLEFLSRLKEQTKFVRVRMDGSHDKIMKYFEMDFYENVCPAMWAFKYFRRNEIGGNYFVVDLDYADYDILNNIKKHYGLNYYMLDSADIFYQISGAKFVLTNCSITQNMCYGAKIPVITISEFSNLREFFRKFGFRGFDIPAEQVSTDLLIEAIDSCDTQYSEIEPFWEDTLYDLSLVDRYI